MIVHCANCEKEGKPAFIREKEPYESTMISHGICNAHHAALLLEIAERQRTEVETCEPK